MQSRSEQAHSVEPGLSILDAVADPNLFAPWFSRGDWSAWQAFLGALFSLPLSEAQAEVYRACTRRSALPERAFREGWLVVGRRGGKSFIASLIAVYLAAFFDYRPYLQPGERGSVLILAEDRKQARVIFRYVRALVMGVPMLASLVERETAEGIDSNTNVSIEITTASFRRTRGYTIVAALLDELAYWFTEGANPDHEILAALRPGMATIPNAMLIALSSPYAKSGELYQAHKRYFASDDAEVLVWQADTRTMNPSVPERITRDAYERDPESAAAEYGAQFRADLESFVPREVVEACVVMGRYELAYVSNHTYRAFVDPSGGSNDSMTLAIGHREAQNVVIDAVRERRPPFSPEAVVGEFAELVKAYGAHQVTGDRYAGEWPRERFREHGITYNVAAKPRSDLYRDMLPLLNSQRLALPKHPRLVSQLSSLERRTSRAGKDSIDHPPGSHDDIANAVAGLVNLLAQPRPVWGVIDTTNKPQEPRREPVAEPADDGEGWEEL